MNSSRTLFLLLIALVIFCFGLGANLAPRLQAFENKHGQSNNFFADLLGGSRQLFANSFFVKADEYYHSGYYPTIFDKTKAFQTPHIAEDTHAIASHNQGDELGFMGPTRDWIDAFERHFIPNRHTHLDTGGATGDLSESNEVAEILPWLKLSAELDPEIVRTYVVTAYWLRTRLDQVDDAKKVLRAGLRHNPGNPELLFALGRLYFENDHNLQRARDIWEAALRSWAKQTKGEPKSEKDDFDNRFLVEQLDTHLAELEEKLGNFDIAIAYWQEAKPLSPEPGDVQKRIDDLQRKAAYSLRVTPEMPW